MRLLSSVPGLLSIAASLIISSTTLGQLSENDSVAYQASIKNALSVYHDFLRNPSGLFNGSQYISYANFIKNDHPYFLSDSMNKGNIVYDSVLYENVLMFYDLVKEQVVINDPYKIYQISLINEKVKRILGAEPSIRTSASRQFKTVTSSSAAFMTGCTRGK